MVLATMVVLAFLTIVDFAPLDTFEPVDDGRVLVAQAIHGQGEAILWSGAREEPDKVTVFVLRLHPPGIRAGLALRSTIEVRLTSALGNRALVDGTGRRVQIAR